MRGSHMGLWRRVIASHTAYQLDEAAVARGAGVRRHDAVEGPVMPPEALQPDADDHGCGFPCRPCYSQVYLMEDDGGVSWLCPLSSSYVTDYQVLAVRCPTISKPSQQESRGFPTRQGLLGVQHKQRHYWCENEACFCSGGGGDGEWRWKKKKKMRVDRRHDTNTETN